MSLSVDESVPVYRPLGRKFSVLLPGVSEKSDEFKSCIFRVVLGIERRIGYQVKAFSKIFCLSGDLPHGFTVLGSAGHVFVMSHFSLEEYVTCPT